MTPKARSGSKQLKAAALACALSLGTAACGTTGGPPPPSTAPEAHKAASTSAALRRILQHSSPVPDAVITFYEKRDFRPVWTGSRRARARAALVTLALNHADQQGLRRADYEVPVPPAGLPPRPGRAAARYDLTVTRALFRYAHDVSIGRVDPTAVYKYVDLPRRRFNVGQALSQMLGDDDIDGFLDQLPPPNPQYRRLVAALAHYRAIAKGGGWHTLGPHPSRDRLAERLGLEDPKLASITHPSADEVKAAVRRFQAHHGLTIDGIVGPATLRALNVPASERVKQIAANMERWRWLPRRFEHTYIRVNAAAQTVDFVRNGEVQLESKVVVGRRSMPTPILRVTADAVIANPPWDIPDDIAAKSIVPHLRHDADYLKSRHMTLMDAPKDVTVDWNKVTGDVLPYQIQQLPGPHNALGQVMIDMPNKFYVYLHGTPNQSLFTRDDREISHGCVRVEKIAQLAQLVLSDTDSDPAGTLKAAIASGKTDRLSLTRPIPVYMLYWTVVAKPGGTVDFIPDIYGRDKKLIAALDGKHAASRRRAVAAVAWRRPT